MQFVKILKRTNKSFDILHFVHELTLEIINFLNHSSSCEQAQDFYRYHFDSLIE